MTAPRPSDTSGPTEAAGADGVPEATRAPGASGAPGTSGAAGAAGADETSEATSTTGPHGSHGTTEASMADGASGAPGTSGAAGADETSEATSTTGLHGTTEASMADGASGVPWASGSSGANEAPKATQAPASPEPTSTTNPPEASRTSGASGATSTTTLPEASGAAGAAGAAGATRTAAPVGVPGAPHRAAPATATMTLVRIKLALLRNGLRQSAGRRAAFVVSGVVALLFAALQFLGLAALRGNAHADSLVVLLAALLELGWAVMPLFFPGGDETLDPTRLVMLPLQPRPLVRGLLAASLVGIGPLFTVCLLTGSVISVAHGAAAWVTGVVAVVLATLVCVTLARAVATANTRLLTSRRGRDLAVLSGLVIAVGAQAVNFGAQRLGRAGLGQLDPLGNVLDWVPPASAVSAVDSVSDGAYATAALQLALSVAALAALLAWWARTLTHLMTAPDASTIQPPDTSAARAGSGTGGLARLLPAGRTGTVMERSLRYIWRDPKTKMAWVTSLVVGMMVPVFNALQSTGSMYFACFSSAMLGMLMYNQFGQDGSAFWMIATTVSTPRDAYVELRARSLAILVPTVPFTLLVCTVTTGLLGDWPRLPAILGLSLALLGAMLGTGALSSSLLPYSIPQGGRRTAAPGQASLAWGSVFGGMLGAAVLCAPMIAAVVRADVTGADRTWGVLLLAAGVVYGAGMAYLGLRLAAPRAAARLPEILAAVSKE